jgi:carboxypeptidase Q
MRISSATRASILATLAAAVPLLGARPARAQQSAVAGYADVANRIIAAALKDSAAYKRLSELTDGFGNRLSGSQSLEHAIDWIIAGMKKDGLQNVRGEPVMVPHWVRGEESAELVTPRAVRLPMLGLGGSIATPADGITAEVLVVNSYDDLTAKAAQAKGKIVLFDVPFTDYGETVQYRTGGAVAAAKVGAVASLIRSVTPYSQKTPHTGNMSYEGGVTKIPHAAITLEDAMMLHRMQDRGQKIVVRLKMSARMLADAPSRNVMGEVTGRELPNEVVAIGGHIDSWDVGQGAMDDGGGVVAGWEAVRLIHDLGLRPRRTIRAVGWVNEENGGRGGVAYRDAHKSETHVYAMESDNGVFRPSGFGFTGNDAAYAIAQQIGKLLEPIGAGLVTKGGGGSDIGPIMQAGAPGGSPTVDGSRYFWYHHTDSDTIDKLDARDVALCTAVMAVVAYVIADLPDPLPR